MIINERIHDRLDDIELFLNTQEKGELTIQDWAMKKYKDKVIDEILNHMYEIRRMLG